MPTIRENWDNLSWLHEMGSGLTGGEDEKFTMQSVEECSTACEANPQCFQFVFDGGSCFLGKAIRLGERRDSKDGKIWRSGWNQPRIENWIANQTTCDNVKFPNWLERMG